MKRTCFAVGALAFAGCALCPCEEVEEVTPSETHYVRDAVEPYVTSHLLPGAVSYLYNDGVVECDLIGYADLETKRPITLDDPFMQCSQTKGFCGVTVAKLVEEGRLKLDDPVSKYLPEFGTLWVKRENADGTVTLARATNTLTVVMCLNHTGGFEFELPQFIRMGGWSRRMPLRSVAAMAASLPLLSEPGTKENYSNVGIDVGAAIVEQVTGMRWERYLQETVLDPLGMSASTFWPSEEQVARRIHLYRTRPSAPESWADCHSSNAMQTPYGDDRVFPSAGAGLWTTARDQLKFYKMLMNLGVGDNGVRILEEETVKNLLAVSTRPKGLGGYSLGLGAPEAEKDGDDAWFGHGGAFGTSCSVNWRRRQLKLWVEQLNECGHPWQGAVERATKIFFNGEEAEDQTSAYTGRMK